MDHRERNNFADKAFKFCSSPFGGKKSFRESRPALRESAALKFEIWVFLKENKNVIFFNLLAQARMSHVLDHCIFMGWTFGSARSVIISMGLVIVRIVFSVSTSSITLNRRRIMLN